MSAPAKLKLIAAAYGLLGSVIGFALLQGAAALADADGNPATESIPRVIPYEGTIEIDGASYSGELDMRFTLYDAADTVLWQETYSNTGDSGAPVNVYAGTFSVLLGEYVDLSTYILDAEELYVGIAISTDGFATETALSGRQLVGPAPYAIWASASANLSVAGTLGVGGSANIGGSATVGSLSTSGSATVGSLSTSGTARTGALTVTGEGSFSDMVSVNDGNGVRIGGTTLQSGVGFSTGVGSTDGAQLVYYPPGDVLIMEDQSGFGNGNDRVVFGMTDGSITTQGEIVAGGAIRMPHSNNRPFDCDSSHIGYMWMDTNLGGNTYNVPCICMRTDDGSYKWAPFDNWSASCN